MTRNIVMGFLCGTLCTSGMMFLSQVEYDHVRFPENSIHLRSFRRERKYSSLNTLKYGLPHGGIPIVLNPDYLLQYDQSKRVPLWVGEHIRQEHLEGKANRAKCRFTADERLSEKFRAQNEDYRKSGFSRGHMAAAGNYKHSPESMSDTFYLTNILPQDYKNNSGYWNRMEMHVRDLVKKFGAVSVFSGPVFSPVQAPDGKKYVKYQVIGENDVAVPTHLFKVILVERKNDFPMMAAFIVPNEKLKTQPLENFQVPLHTLERRTGLHFLDKLKEYDDLCKSGGCNLMSDEKFHFYISNRSLTASQSLKDLERNWKRLLLEDEVIPTEEILSIYRIRKQELSGEEQREDPQKQKQSGKGAG